MALGKLSAFTKLAEKRPDELPGAPPPAGAPGLGGEPSSGGNILGTLDRLRAGGEPTGPTSGERARDIITPLAKFGVKNFGRQGVDKLIDYFRGGAPQGADILKDMASTGELGLGADTALSGLGTELPNTTLSTGGGDFSSLLQDFQGSLVNPNFADPTLSLGGDIGTGLSATGEAAAGGAGGIMGSGVTTGAAGMGGAALSMILGIIAQQTGNKELAQAAQALGAAVGVAGTGASIAAAASPAIAASLGLTAGTAGLGAAGGVAAAPFLIASIAHMIDPENTPDVADMFGIGSDNPDPYYKFASKLGQNEGQQGQAFRMLQQALPYAQSKEELGQLVNSYNNYLATTQDAPVTLGGGTSPSHGAPFTPEGMPTYQIGYIPGATGYEHGAGKQTGSPADWGSETQILQGLTDYLKGTLPGNLITQGYGMPGGGLSGEAATRLWQQFTDRGTNFPKYSPAGWEGTTVETGAGQGSNMTPIPGFSAGYVNPDATSAAYAPQGTLLNYGDPGYDYATAGIPEPGKYLGSPSAAWQALLGKGSAPTSTPGAGFSSLGTNSSATAPAGPGAAGGQKSNLQGTLGFAGLTGPLNEIRGGDNPNQV